jgi:hypothetical protein
MISRFKKQLKGAAILGALLIGSNAFAQLGLTWSELGPNNVGGRTRSILVDQMDASGNKLYAAGVSGGIFKSTDAGGTWTKINDQSQSLIVTCMAQASNGDIIFGTGESKDIGTTLDGAGSSGFNGNGLFKLTYNSTTITQLKDETFFGNINDVAVNGPNVYVASGQGFFYSTDGGVNFTEETTSSTSTLSPAAIDVKVAKNGDIYYSSYAAITNSAIPTPTSGVSYVYYAPFGSTSFTNITPSAITSMNRARIEIAPSPVDANYVYLCVSTFTGSFGAALASDDKGVNWSTITLGTSSSTDPFLGGNANYSNMIMADSKQADACFIGGVYLFKWIHNTSAPLYQGTWKQIGSPFALNSQLYVHSGIHDMKFMPSNPDFYYLATDGGIYKVVGYPPGTLGIEYTPFIPASKGLNISQFYSVAIPNFPKTNVVSGNQNVPFQGIGGGCDGNSFTYLSGSVSTNTQGAITLGTSDAFQSDFSKLIPKAVIYSTRHGGVLRTADVESATPPSTFYDASYTVAATGGPGKSTFANENTPMRLWEQYKGADSMYFYNEPATISYLTSNTTQTTYTFSNGRTQRPAKYDTIYVRTKSDKKMFKPLLATKTYTNLNTTATTFTTNNLRTNTISKYDSLTVQVKSEKTSLFGPFAITTFTNMNTTATSFSVSNIRSMQTQKYDIITIIATSQKAGIMTQTVIPLSQTITIKPTYSLSNITGYNVTSIKSVRVDTCIVGSGPTCFTTSPPSAAAAGSPNTIYLDNSTFNDSIRFTFGSALNDSCVVTVKASYKYNQTMYMYPSYTGSVIASVSVLGEANTSSAANNTITLNSTTLNDVIKFTFIDPPNDSSAITVRCKNDFYQQFKIMPVYTGTNISSYTVIGDANTSSAANTSIKLSNTLDTIKYTFRVAPNDSCTVSNTMKYRYVAGDTVKIQNTDISGQFFWTSKVLTGPLATNTKNPYLASVKLPLYKSARLAVAVSTKTTGVEGPSVFVVKRPLNFAVNPDWVKVAGKNSRMDGPGGVATPNTSTVTAPVLGTTMGTTINRLEWSPSGKYIYFSTASSPTTSPAAYYLYRISHLEMISDEMGDDYGGVFTSDIDSGTVARKCNNIRTTPIGKFPAPITGIAIATNDSTMMITLGGYGTTNSVYYSNGHTGKMNPNSTDDSNFSLKTGTGLPTMPVYTGILEMNDNKKAIIGTEKGIYSTMDITAASPTWVKESTGVSASDPFPNVPVFQIRQQTMESYRCYNSGIIYAATHGRGIWSTDKYFNPNYIGIEEQEKPLAFDSNIKLFPNPATNSTNIWFKAAGDANYRITVYDINGRTLMQHTTGKLMEGEQLFQMNTAELSSGIYFVSINGTNNFNANTKLVITR